MLLFQTPNILKRVLHAFLSVYSEILIHENPKPSYYISIIIFICPLIVHRVSYTSSICYLKLKICYLK